MGVGKASSAQADLQCLAAVAADAREVLEQVVMHPGSLRHSTGARAVNREHLSRCALVLKCIVVDLAIVARYQQVPAITGELKYISRQPAVAGAGLHLHRSDRVSQP